MSHTARCLRSFAAKVRVPAARRYMQAQALKQAPSASKTHVRNTSQRQGYQPLSSSDLDLPEDMEHTHELETEHNASSPTDKPKLSKYAISAGDMAWHLNQLFSPLEFSEELAKRALTHSSHPDAREGHNGALSFLGRRTLEAYLLLFLTSSTKLHRGIDVEQVIAQTISSPVLGQYIGSQWGLGRVMKWSPAVPRGQGGRVSKRDALVGAGLWKVQGEAVAAVLGAVNYQYGSTTSHLLFHTRILPHLLLTGTRNAPGLLAEFHDDAKKVCTRMGGENARLLSRERKRELVERAKAEKEKEEEVEVEVEVPV